ncbi:MAG: uroporphyrinogen-III synthase [Gammaproteobacteria bacterium]|nr:uroporphyrinogen-III synthase [Gammaproteobacteria bacterium]
MPALNGVCALVTRPLQQGQALCERIEQRGGSAIAFPVIEIQPPSDAAQFRRQLDVLSTFDLAIFVSVNAVNAVADARVNTHSWPEGTAIAAVGRATASALSRRGLPVTWVAPRPFNSESLLSLPALQHLGGQRVVIFRGQQGRPLLGDTLEQRGAHVRYVESYVRAVAHPDPSALYQAWRNQVLSHIVITSNEGLENLAALVDSSHQQDLFNTQLVAISERAVPLAKTLGFIHPPTVASEASNNAIVSAIERTLKI